MFEDVMKLMGEKKLRLAHEIEKKTRELKVLKTTLKQLEQAEARLESNGHGGGSKDEMSENAAAHDRHAVRR